jgi:glucose-1-phosphate cytidylyltransferase
MTDANGLVTSIKEITQSGIRINAGFFVLKKDIFKYVRPGEELVIKPFQRLIRDQQLAAYEYDGFFTAMDTFKDKQSLEELSEGGRPPWEIWKKTKRLVSKSTDDGADQDLSLPFQGT